ncbi:MAG: ASKHA domain-containing protein [Acidobacteria bacterium]|jgi:uncharacterized 2Fe-2S/4Fe-4S cluster protein (DUF4445 family)|nr:ASKHA domain-containing protein [Acidobacteriota bacterium]
MTNIIFQPSGKTVDVPYGTELLEAARKAEVLIESPCGGSGTCGKCLTRIISGKVAFKNHQNHEALSSISTAGRYALACQTKILDEPLLVEIPEQSGREGGQFIDETGEMCLKQHELFPKGWQPSPLTHKLVLEVPPPQLADGLSDLDRLAQTLSKRIEKKDIHYPLSVIHRIAEVLRRENGKVTLTIAETPAQCRVIHIEPGDQTTNHYGLAVDIGTTTVAVQLVYLPTAAVLGTQTAYNDQIECGLDIISRINYAARPHRLQELRERILKTINFLVNQICRGKNIDPKDINSVVIAGNTTMIHLLLGLPPENIRLEPYTPTLLTAPTFIAGEIGININPQAVAYISPAVGSYVGGDITSGLLCTGMAGERDEVSLFIDIGTNGEIVIGNNEFLVTCACSAGPAFEGGGIEQGMRAALGAIEKIEVDPITGMPTYQTIGQVKPKGICGSGMISLLANLFQTGWLDPAGKLNRAKKSPAIRVNGRQAYYIAAHAEESGLAGKPVMVSETDIENIIRAKAAIYSAASLLLEQVGMKFADLTHIFIAGGFGRFLDIEKAITLGLIPDLPRERYHYIGNSSLMGAYMVLVSQETRQRQQEIARRMTYIELSTDPSYMNQYTGALFLPHTDINQFPSVKALEEEKIILA